MAIPVETRDEIGDLTVMFNEMSGSLSAKEDLLNEQRGQIRNLLNSFMPAAIADKLRRGEEVGAREHPNVTVIYATVLGLDRIQAQLDSGEALASPTRSIVNSRLRQRTTTSTGSVRCETDTSVVVGSLFRGWTMLDGSSTLRVSVSESSSGSTVIQD